MGESDHHETKILQDLNNDLVQLSVMTDRIWRRWLTRKYRPADTVSKRSEMECFNDIIVYTKDIETKAKSIRKESVKRFLLKIASMSEDSLGMQERYNVPSTALGRKKYFANYIKDQMKLYELIILHPISGNPCTIQVIASPDGNGRYVLEELGTRKRTHTSRSLAELSSFRLEEMPKAKGEPS